VARSAQGAGGGGGGDDGMRAFSVCGHFEMRQRREGKRSAGSFEAQVYLSDRRIYLGRAMYIRQLPMNIRGRFIG
jgi:hypothetical protein